MAAMNGDKEKVTVEFDELLNCTAKLIENCSSISNNAESNLTSAFLSKTSDAVITAEEEAENVPPTLHIYPTNVVVEKVNTDKEVHLVYSALPNNVVIHENSAEDVTNVQDGCELLKLNSDDKTETEDEEVETEEEEEEEEEEEAEAEVDDEETEAEEEEEEEEVEEKADDEAEAEEAEAEAEEAEEEEESMEMIKIGKKKYFVGESSKSVYVFINDEEAGDCLGKYVDGKIVPSN
jgi:cobalamin biosynthesis protein CobT